MNSVQDRIKLKSRRNVSPAATHIKQFFSDNTGAIEQRHFVDDRINDPARELCPLTSLSIMSVVLFLPFGILIDVVRSV